MILGKLKNHSSWLISAAIAVGVAAWLASGQFGGDDHDAALAADVSAAGPAGELAGQPGPRVHNEPA